jgi:hypothetical protein
LIGPEEKRKYPRVKTDNLISYVCMDEEGNELDQGIGRALDISQGGLLLESHTPIRSEKILLASVDVNNELIEINGEVAYCRESGPGMFLTGIRFLESNEKIRNVVINLVKVYNLQKNR